MIYEATIGNSKTCEVSKTVKMLPKPENRRGWELRCEVVQPILEGITLS